MRGDGWQGGLRLLERLLRHIRHETDERGSRALVVPLRCASIYFRLPDAHRGRADTAERRGTCADRARGVVGVCQYTIVMCVAVYDARTNDGVAFGGMRASAC